MVAEQSQRLTELGMELAGTAAVLGQMPKLLQSYLGGRAITIAGGTVGDCATRSPNASSVCRETLC